jgi:formylglycine-generating enzyme
MSTRPPSPFTILTMFLLCVTSYASQPIMTMLPEEAEPGQQRLIWSTDPGIRYELQESSSLDDPDSWTTVAGYPTEAQALAQQKLIELDAPERKFYRVRMLDEQPPVIVSRIPGNEAFGVSRYLTTITVSLDDLTGVDTNSISFTVGDHGTYTLSDSEFWYDDGTLSFWLGGDTALGEWGSTVTVSLVAADILGNVATNTWSFEMEIAADVEENLFVFGSLDAQRAGQRLQGPAASLAARFGGPVRASGTDVDWEIETVTSNTIVLAYTSDEAPTFSVGQYLANKVPAHVDEIFYRQIDGVTDDTGNKRLTLETTEVTLPDLVAEASFTLAENTTVLEFDADGNLVKAFDFEATFELPSIGADFTGETIFSNTQYQLWLDEGAFLFHPYLKTSLQIDLGGVRRFAAQAGGDLEIRCVPHLYFHDTYSTNVSHELWRATHWLWGAVGVVPVGIEIAASVTAVGSLQASATADIKAGFRQYGSMGVAGRYDRDATPEVSWDRWLTIPPLEQVPLEYTLNGQGQAMVGLVPQLDVRVYGAAGVYLNVDPRVELSGSATVVNGTLTEASWLLGAYADVNAGLSVIGFDDDDLPSLPPFGLFEKEWGESYVYDPPPPAPPVITHHPASQNAKLGDSVVFSVTASGSGAMSYQWYHNGILRPGATGQELTLNNITSGHQGSYHVRITGGGGSTNSVAANLSLVTGGSTGPTPSAGMVLIPAGNFQMGDTFSEGWSAELPLHTVYVSAFYMDRHEVTKALWDEVYTWAVGNGYSFDNAGSGKAANHPVHTINWYDMVKWCNARSEMEGRTPAYYTSSSRTSANIYRTGQVNVQNDWVRWDAGYRLPTEAEWEKAARGGQSGRRFPWGDTINHNHANYRANGSAYSYDTSPYTTWTYHPTYNTGGTPYTSPVGSFAANGYGLYDMAGNVWEWTWDWYGSSYYGSSPGSDPRGPATGSPRVSRGGGWLNFASRCRVAGRDHISPDDAYYYVGFRVVLHPGQ